MEQPILAKPVVIIGGPTGPYVGDTGPAGPLADLLVGSIGVQGHTGITGFAGPVGLAGIASSLIGGMGPTGPLGRIGYTGPVGPTGHAGILTADRVGYYENTQGHVNSSRDAQFVGCKFRYTQKVGGWMLRIFTGTVEPASADVIGLSSGWGEGAAPNIGDYTFPGWYSTKIKVERPNLKLPFMWVEGPPGQFTGGHYDGYIGRELWFDMIMSVGSTNFQVAPTKIRNISCLILEL